MTSIVPTHRVGFAVGDKYTAKGVVDVLTEIFFEGQAAIAAFERPDVQAGYCLSELANKRQRLQQLEAER